MSSLIEKLGDRAGNLLNDVANGITDAQKRAFDIQDDSFGQSEYNFSYKAFPNDLTSSYNGHYMVININVPVTSYSGPTEARGGFSSAFKLLPNEYSKVDILRFGGGEGATVIGGVNTKAKDGPTQGEFLALPRGTRRIAESIALFMPNSMVYSSQNAYEDISLTAIGGTIGTGALSVMSRGAVTAIAGYLQRAGGQVIGQGSRLMGYPINPRVEIVYATTPQRSFVFEILMAARNEKESLSIKAIIQTLRFHSAPELTNLGFTLIPPAEFDITFYNKGVENTNIPRINTCVLERIDVDYSPTGAYSTFKDGTPSFVRLSMGFREVEILSKQRVLQKF